MIKLKNYKNQKINITKLVQILFLTFPISFIIGNLVISLHLLLFIVTSLFLIKNEQLKLRFKNFYWLLIFFFLYLLLSTTIQFPDLFHEWKLSQNVKIESIPLENNPIFKSFLLMRFLILIFLVDILFINKILNVKKIFFVSLICTSFVSFDVIIQYITGFDLFGLKSHGTTNSGPFGDEFIAGSYLQKLSLLSIFYSFLIFKNKKYKNIFIIFIILLHSTAILLAGNKMSLILFLFGIILTILFVKNLRYSISVGLIAFLSISIIMFKNDQNLGARYSAFFNALSEVIFNELNFIKTIKQNKLQTKKTREGESKIRRVEEQGSAYLRGSGYYGIYRTSLVLWKEQPWVGHGLKSFRFKCWLIISRPENKEAHRSLKPLNCANHSHNYYLELLSEAGIFGTTFIIIFFIIIFKDSFVYLKGNYRKIDSDLYLFIPIFLTFFIEIFPLKSTGSFFTTWNATFIWLITSLLCAMLYSKKT